jgi:hypothetical protein
MPYDGHVVIGGVTFSADSARKIVTTNTTSKIDGYGSLTTPSGNFKSLRQYLNIDKTAETYFYINGSWALYKSKNQSTNKLRWWANGYAFPVLECRYYPNSGIVRSIYFLKQDEIVTIIQKLTDDNKIITSPNPANECIIFSNLKEKHITLAIFNSVGELLYRNTPTSLEELVNVAGWQPGMYVYRITNRWGVINQADKFNVIH